MIDCSFNIIQPVIHRNVNIIGKAETFDLITSCPLPAAGRCSGWRRGRSSAAGGVGYNCVSLNSKEGSNKWMSCRSIYAPARQAMSYRQNLLTTLMTTFWWPPPQKKKIKSWSFAELQTKHQYELEKWQAVKKKETLSKMFWKMFNKIK